MSFTIVQGWQDKCFYDMIIGVYFETENIYTLDPDCKQNLSIHAMLADWESANKSRRMILSYDQRICTGQYPVLDLLGYRHTKEGELIIQPEEAKTVRFIFLAYIGGYDCDEIAEILTERERPTLRGRTDWNASMVMNVMSNERRWGDLEARKTIVIDYVEHKSKKNEHDRVSAYEEDHHEPIVSREIALAAQMVKKSSRKMTEGVPDFSVIHKGNLKGFVSICPGWGGIDGSALLEICQEVYEEEELEELNHKIRIWSGEEQGKVVSMALSGYQVPHGIYFLNKSLQEAYKEDYSVKTLEKLVFPWVRSDWGDFSDLHNFVMEKKNIGLSSRVQYNDRHDIAYLKIFQNVENAFVVEQPHQIPDIWILNFVKKNEKYGWRIYGIGDKIADYKESGSILDWFEHIKEDK